MFNVLQLIPAVYRVRKHKRTWNIYKTENGFVINLGKIYIYYNTATKKVKFTTRMKKVA